MRTLLLSLFILCFVKCQCQDKFSKEIQTISENLYNQLTGPSAKAKLGKDTIGYKIAIVSIENEDKKTTKLTELIENKLAINLAMKSEGKFDILDRNYLEKLLQEKNISLKYDNVRDFAKDLGRIKAANFIIVGTLNTFENDFDLNLQITETKEGNIIGGVDGSITQTQLLKDKNTNNPPTNSKPPFQVGNESNPQENSQVTPIKSTTGSIEIKNKMNTQMLILMGTQTVEPANFGKNYEQLTLSANSSDKFEGVQPGTYYICATAGRTDMAGCRYSKRVVVEAGKNIVVNISSWNSW